MTTGRDIRRCRKRCVMVFCDGVARLTHFTCGQVDLEWATWPILSSPSVLASRGGQLVPSHLASLAVAPWARTGQGRPPSHSGASTLARRLPRVLTPACADSRVRRLAPHRCSQPRRQSQGGHGPWGAQVRSPVLTTFPLLPLGLPLASWVASRVQTPQPQPTTDDD